MSTNVQSAGAPPERISQKRLWFGACAGAAAFALQGFVCFEIAVQACKDGHVGDWGPLNAAGVRWIMGGISIFLLLVAIYGGMISYRNWRVVSEQRRLGYAEATGREAFMALAGVFVTVAFVLGMIWAGLPMALLNTCVTAR